MNKNGNRIWVALDSVALPDGTYMAFCKDISDRKKSELELKEFALFNRTMLDTIPAPIFYKDIYGKYLGVNKSFTEFYGITEDKIKGKTVYEE